MPPHAPVPVAILGATGMVGQRMIQRLADHPWFTIAWLGASERSAGKPYAEATTWRLPGRMPAGVADLPVHECLPDRVPAGVRVALSALDSSVARQTETAFRDAGFAVVTNASAFRMDPDVPLVVPEVNPDHTALVDRQTGGDPARGYIVANPNCCAIPLAMALAPLHRRWGVQAAIVSTWQAVSGAGYPGESAWDMVGSVHPHPGNEEEKLREEPQKILGDAGDAAVFPVSARCVRVPTADGHLLGVHVRLAGDPSAADVQQALADWQGFGPRLPSTPSPLVELQARRDRPSPRFDVDLGDGMALVVGRIERCEIMGVKLYALAHNTVRGAAGAAIANLELLVEQGRLPG
ncbi:MAG: aspartate-semialdehyde dehydrogenase [Alphaproteobacteria bacterium]|nr:aspartate-semialdehyde dehydrogenase [Alphaproteobacteria bacterium]